MTAQNQPASPAAALVAQATVATLPGVYSPKQQRAYDLLQLPDSRPQPASALLVRSEELIAPHLPQIVRTALNQGQNMVEEVFDSELGQASARARAFLSSWITLRRYKPAWEIAGCVGNDVPLWRTCSAAFSCCFDSIDAWIRSQRHHESEDTLHALANGEISEPVFGPVGGGRSGKIGEKAIFSEKALITELAAQDPRRYGKAVGESSGLAITLNISVPDESAKQAEIIDVDGEEVSA